jgi:hypothetical protein
MVWLVQRGMPSFPSKVGIVAALAALMFGSATGKDVALNSSEILAVL